MKQALRILVVIFSITLLSATAYAASHLERLVDAGWLSQHKNVTVVDVRDGGAYAKGHIPGAINIPVNDLQSKPDAILLPVRQLEKILGEKGLDIHSEVVLYGAGREIAYLEYWMLDYMGMDRLHVLDGGIEQWKGELSAAETKLASSVFKAKPRPNLYASTSDVKNALRKPHIILLDVRTTGEYKGTDVRSLRGGHIPGATNIDFEENYQDGSTKLKSMDELAKLYGRLDKKKEVIVYCQTGTRAANTFFVLKALGFPKVRNYDASWIEWGSNSSLPADDVSYLNFVSVMKAIKKLEKEVQVQKHQ